MDNQPIEKGGGLSRRDFLKLGSASLGALFLAACGVNPAGDMPKPGQDTPIPTHGKGPEPTITPDLREKAASVGLIHIVNMVSGLMSGLTSQDQQKTIKELNDGIATANLYSPDGTTFQPLPLVDQQANPAMKYIIVNTPSGNVDYLFNQGNQYRLATLNQAQNGDLLGINPLTNRLLFVKQKDTQPGKGLLVSWNDSGEFNNLSVMDTKNLHTANVGAKIELKSAQDVATPEPPKFQLASLDLISNSSPAVLNVDQGYYLPDVLAKTTSSEVKLSPLLPAIPEQLLSDQLTEINKISQISFNPDTNRAIAYDEKNQPIAEAEWVMKQDETGKETFEWQWGTPFIKTNDGSVELRSPAEKLKNEVTKTFYEKMNLESGSTVLQCGKITNDQYCWSVNGYPLLTYLGKETGWSITYLKTLAEKLGKKIGTNETYFEGKGNAQQLVVENFNLLHGETDFFWNYIEPTRGNFSQSRINHIKKQIKLAQANGMDFIGSIFSWFQIPDWVKNSNFSRDELEKIVTDHVEKMLGLFPEINKWVVVNELHPKEYHEDFLRDRLGGPENYLKLVFGAARKIRPDLTLIYSDNGNETAGSSNYQRNLQYTDLLKRDGLVDALAMQMHIDARYPPAKEAIVSAMTSFASKGIKVYITELDVNLKNIKRTPDERYSLQAKIYADTVAAAIEAEDQICPIISSWNNYGDQYSWYEIPGAAPKDRSSPDADPTMFDDQGNPKQAYYETLKTMYKYLSA